MSFRFFRFSFCICFVFICDQSFSAFSQTSYSSYVEEKKLEQIDEISFNSQAEPGLIFMGTARKPRSNYGFYSGISGSYFSSPNFWGINDPQTLIQGSFNIGGHIFNQYDLWFQLKNRSGNNEHIRGLSQTLGDFHFGAKYSDTLANFWFWAGTLQCEFYNGVGDSGVHFPATSVKSKIISSLSLSDFVPIDIHISETFFFNQTKKLDNPESIYEYFSQGINNYHQIITQVGLEGKTRYGNIVGEYGLTLPMGIAQPLKDISIHQLSIGYRYSIFDFLLLSIAGMKEFQEKRTQDNQVAFPFTIFASLYFTHTLKKTTNALNDTPLIIPVPIPTEELVVSTAKQEKRYIRGKIFDKTTQKPISETRIYINDSLEAITPNKTTGEYKILVSEPIAMKLSFEHEKYQSQTKNYSKEAIESLLHDSDNNKVKILFHDENIYLSATAKPELKKEEKPLSVSSLSQVSIEVFDENHQPFITKIKLLNHDGKLIRESEAAQIQSELGSGKYSVEINNADTPMIQRFEVFKNQPLKMIISVSSQQNFPKQEKNTASKEIPKQEKSFSIQLKENKIITQTKISFVKKTLDITEESKPVISELADFLKEHPEILQIEIQSYMDNKGKPKEITSLTEKQSQRIQQLLVEHGIQKSRLIAKGYGSSRPIASNNSWKNRLKNRRVEFKVLQISSAL